MGRPTRIEEVKKLLLAYKREVKNVPISFPQLASFLRALGLSVDAKTVANWMHELDQKSFDAMTIQVQRKTYRRFGPCQAPYAARPTKEDYIRTLGVIIEAEGCPEELLPASFPFPPLPLVFLKLPFRMQNLEAFDAVEPEIEKAEEEPLTTGDEGYVLRDRDAVHPSGYQLRT